MQMLNALLVTNCRKLVRRAGPGLRWILAAVAVYLIEMLGLRVIRLQLVVANGPGRRDTAVMANLTKVFLSQTKESSAVELCVTTNEIICMRMQFLTFTV